MVSALLIAIPIGVVVFVLCRLRACSDSDGDLVARQIAKHQARA